MTIRIAFIAPAHSIHTQRWVRAFVSRPDYKVTLISPYGSPAESIDLAGVRLIIMHPPSSSQPAATRILQVIRNYSRLRLVLIKQSFDLHHIHQLPPPATAMFFLGLPRLFVSVWGSDIIDVVGRKVHPLRDFSRRLLLRQAKVITASSHYLASATRTYTPPGKDIHVIPFGVEWSQFATSLTPRPAPPPIRIIVAKHLYPLYGIHYLLEAFRLVVDLEKENELLIVGDGPQRAELELLSGKLGLHDRVSFLGHIPHTRIKSLLYRSHIFVMPSVFESLGVAALEAQATGLPVVATQVGGIPEIVQDNQTGLLVPPENPEALATAILRLIQDPDLREHLGRSGQEFVRRNFDWKDCVEKMQTLYSKMIAT